LRAGADAVEQAAAWLLQRRGTADALAGATPFLRLVGDVVGGWLLGVGAVAAERRLGDGGDTRLRARAPLARFYAEQVLAAAAASLPAVIGGAGELAMLTPDLLGPA
jgi:hypothetical protein